ncbi:MAG TPA: hypothetical protein VF397_03185 [Pyrinomonadaceae bacterium]
MSIFLHWEIKHAENTETLDWWALELAQKFVAENEVTSIVFYLDGLKDVVKGIGRDIARQDVASFTKEEFATITMEWVDATRKELHLVP